MKNSLVQLIKNPVIIIVVSDDERTTTTTIKLRSTGIIHGVDRHVGYGSRRTAAHTHMSRSHACVVRLYADDKITFTYS